MSSSPAFGVTLRNGRCVIGTAETTTDKTGATTTNIKDIITGVANGTQIYEVVVQADGDPADSIVLIFLHNGTDYRLYDEVDIGNPAAGSATTPAYRESRKYENLYLPSGSWKIAAGLTAATTAGNVNVWAHGADL